MAKPTIKFTAVAYAIGDNTGYRPQLEAQAAVADLDFCKEVVESKRLAMSAEELLHAIEMLGEVAALKVAEDGRPRAISKLIKWNRFAKGTLESPADAWNDSCKAYIRPQLLADVEKYIDATFVNENEGIKVKLNYVTYIGAQSVQNVLKSLTAFAGYGNNMTFDAKAGDTASLSWIQDGITKTVDLTCTESDVAHATFAFPNEIIALEAGTALTFVMKSRGGVEGGATFTNKKAVTYLGYDGEAMVWNIFTEGLAKNTVKVDDAKLVTINGAKLNGCEQVVLTLTTKDGTTDAITLAAADLVSNTAGKITLHFTQAMVDATTLKDHDLAGATGKLTVVGEEGIVSDFAYAYAE